MSGAVAAHAAYNGSGTQGLAVTNKVDDDGDISSVFWNKNDTTRQLLHGSTIVEIPASGSGGALSRGGNQYFTVHNDTDAVGDLYLQISTSGVTSATIKRVDLLNCIKRVEFLVGTQVWQTMEGSDIAALNLTEMSEDAYESFFLAMSGGFGVNGTRNTVGVDPLSLTRGEVSTDVTSDISGVLRLPLLCRSVGPKLPKYSDVTESCYLMAGAPHQTVKVKVYMATSLPASLANANFNLKLWGQSMVMCNEEREQIKAMPMGLPKRVKMTQNQLNTYTLSGAYSDPNGDQTGDGYITKQVKLDLDHFSLFASHIVVILGQAGTALDSTVSEVELKLNSSSFSGILQGQMLTGSVADALGLYSNGIYLNASSFSYNYFVFPLASHAYDASSVPLNRFDNIRLDLTVIVTGPPTGDASSDTFTISATCVGETTALYKGGAASLAMY